MGNRGASDVTMNEIAAKLDHARSNNYQIPPLTKSIPELSTKDGYRIASIIKTIRCGKGRDEVMGRKIGFTNKSIWPEFNVDRSNWSYMYRSSIVDLTAASTSSEGVSICDLSNCSNLEPKIEPEIVLGLKSKISSQMTDEQILGSIEWIAHGFELVCSVFPGWKFTAADTTAAFALHSRLLVGPKKYLPLSSAGSPTELVQQLRNFKISLFQNGERVDTGGGSNVLGSPINALRHLAELLETDDVNLPLGKHEMVTTGTLTRALSIGDGDVWRTELESISIPGLNVRFETGSTKAHL